ncbi:MAG: Tim44/TimA family putative adaptor protein [Pseudomonadota bacterium]
MNEVFDIYTIVFLVLAVVIFLRLRSVLGRRNGHERPPTDIYRPSPRTANSEDNVVPLPGRNGSTETVAADVVDEEEPATPLEKELRDIGRADPSFQPDTFLDGAKMAYEMIVSAFAAGDRKTLKPLLARDVFDGFVSVIADRESRKETVESNFIGINKAEITDAAFEGRMATVTVRFVSELVSATRNEAGAIVDGDPTEVMTVTDIWAFARDVNNRDPNWKLVSTETND